MNTKRIILYVTLAVIVVGAVFIYLWTFRKAEVSVGSQKAAFVMNADELLKQFEDDETSANTTYLDKVILVKGPVSSFTEDSLVTTVYLKDPEAISGVLCSFNNSVIDTGKLSTGEIVQVKGLCSGYLLDVVLNKCILVK